MGIRQRNIKLLLETVTYIATTETVTFIIAIEIVMCIMHTENNAEKNVEFSKTKSMEKKAIR